MEGMCAVIGRRKKEKNNISVKSAQLQRSGEVPPSNSPIGSSVTANCSGEYFRLHRLGYRLFLLLRRCSRIIFEAFSRSQQPIWNTSIAHFGSGKGGCRGRTGNTSAVRQ